MQFIGQYCHEYRKLGDLHTSFGFGRTPEEAQANAEYGAPGNEARDHALGFGDWKLEEDSSGDHWVTRINSKASA